MLNQLALSDLGIIFAAILLSMAFHEAMHAFVAHWLGDTTAKDEGRLTLNPLKHIDIYTTILLPLILILLRITPFFVARPVPFNPNRVKYGEYGAAIMAVAGPFTNFGLAVAASLLLRGLGGAVGTEFYNVFSIFIVVNLGFFVFNMIPFPPLDGSRLLYAFAPEGLQRVMYQIESMGFMTILVFMFLLFPIIGPIVGNLVSHLYYFLLA